MTRDSKPVMRKTFHTFSHALRDVYVRITEDYLAEDDNGWGATVLWRLRRAGINVLAADFCPDAEDGILLLMDADDIDNLPQMPGFVFTVRPFTIGSTVQVYGDGQTQPKVTVWPSPDGTEVMVVGAPHE